MELLIVLVAELLLAVMVPVIAIMGGIFGLLLDVFLWVFGAGASRRKFRSQSAPVTGRKRRKAMRVALVGLLLITLGGLEVVNRFYFAPTMRWVADVAASRAGYSVDIAQIEGNLWRGMLRMEGLKMRGRTQDGATATLTARAVDLDLVLSSLLRGTVRLSQLSASDLEVLAQQSAATEQLRRGEGGRQFAVEDMKIVNATMVVETAGGGRHTLRISEGRAQPLRSRCAAFDLLFRSNLDAMLDGTALTVRTQVIDGNGRHTEWALDELDLKSLAAFTDTAPVRWFDGGTVSARMEDSWRLDDVTIDSDWDISLRDARVAVPEGAPMSETLLVGALAEISQRSRGDLDLAFRLQLDENGFRDSASADLSAWWAALVRGLAAALAASEGIDAHEVESSIQRNTQQLRDLLGIQRQ